MNNTCRARLRRLSVSCSILTACIVIARPTHRVYAMDVNDLQTKARKGYVAEQLELGEAYLMGKGLPKSDKDAEYWYEKAANSGNAEAARKSLRSLTAAGTTARRLTESRFPRRSSLPISAYMRRAARIPGRQVPGKPAMPLSARSYRASAVSSRRSTTLESAGVNSGLANHASGSMSARLIHESGK